MQLTRLFPAAALAWTATAMLVTPDTSAFTEDDIKIMEDHRPTGIERLAMDPQAVTVRLPCDGCAVAQGSMQEEGRTWDVSGNKMTDLLLVFTQDESNIFLGGLPVYGSQVAKDLPLTKQVNAVSDQDDFEITKDDLSMAVHIDVGDKIPVDNLPNAFMTQFKVEVLGIDGRVVHVPSAVFGVLETADGLHLSDIKIVPTVTTLADAQCQTVLCRIKAQIAAKLIALKEGMKTTATKAKTGCMRMMGMHGKHGKHAHKHGHKHEQADAASTVVDRLRGGPNKFQGPAGHPMKKPCGRHGFLGRLAHSLRSFARHVVMPVLVGIAAGMAVSAMGMVVGQIVFMICMRLRGRRQQQGGYVIIHQVEQGEDLEQADEQLPKYEPADAAMPPAYVDEKTQVDN